MTRLGEIAAEKAGALKGLVLDVDGVLTRGEIFYTSGGDEGKAFCVKDGTGIKYWQRVGHVTAILSGRKSPVIERRAEELAIAEVVMGAKDKLPAFERICERLKLQPHECVYVGDDLPDIPVIRAAGLGLAVADAAVEVRECAAGVTEAPGGQGAVREVVEVLLKAQGLWQTILSRYL